MILPREDGLLPLPCSFLLWPAGGSTEEAPFLAPFSYGRQRKSPRPATKGRWGGARGEAAKRWRPKGVGRGKRGRGGGEWRLGFGGKCPPPFWPPPLMGLVASPKVGLPAVARGPGCQKTRRTPSKSLICRFLK